MSTSDLEGVTPFDPSIYAADEPVGAARVRDELVNTALHLADEAAQVRYAWVAVNGALQVGNEAPHAEIEAVSALDVASGYDPGESGQRWYLFGEGVSYAPKIKAGGTPYPLRIHVAGASSGGDRVDFGVVVAPRNAPQLQATWGDTPQGAVKKWGGITSTSAAWLTPDDGTSLLEIDKRIVEEALALEPSWSTLTDIGGNRTSVRLPLLQVKPFGQTWNAASVPELHGLVIAEVIGT